jgi:hypothetical protein
VADVNPLPGSLEEQALTTLLDVIKAGATPAAAQAQAMMLRRLALEGDVVGSRVPAPRNITEIGGYINLLTDLGEPDIRTQLLASLLGVSGPAMALDALSGVPPISWVTIPNDRPAGAAQAVIPLSISIRSDFVASLQTALKSLHDHGCTLPLTTTMPLLPPAGNGVPAIDPLPYIGRVISVVAAAALADPDNDPIALARQGTDSFALVARVLSPGPIAVAPAAWEALKCDTTSCTTSPAPAGGRAYVTLAPALAVAGFYAGSPPPQPASNKDRAWATLTNITGLVAGVTKLGDELRLLYSADQIASSSLSGQLTWVWDGTAFKQP